MDKQIHKRPQTSDIVEVRMMGAWFPAIVICADNDEFNFVLSRESGLTSIYRVRFESGWWRWPRPETAFCTTRPEDANDMAPVVCGTMKPLDWGCDRSKSGNDATLTDLSQRLEETKRVLRLEEAERALECMTAERDELAKANAVLIAQAEQLHMPPPNAPPVVSGIAPGQQALVDMVMELARTERGSAVTQVQYAQQLVEMTKQGSQVIEDRNRQLRRESDSLHQHIAELRLKFIQHEEELMLDRKRAVEVERQDNARLRTQLTMAEQALIKQERALTILQAEVDVSKMTRDAQKHIDEMRAKIEAASSPDDAVRAEKYREAERKIAELERRLAPKPTPVVRFTKSHAQGLAPGLDRVRDAYGQGAMLRLGEAYSVLTCLISGWPEDTTDPVVHIIRQFLFHASTLRP